MFKLNVLCLLNNICMFMYVVNQLDHPSVRTKEKQNLFKILSKSASVQGSPLVCVNYYVIQELRVFF